MKGYGLPRNHDVGSPDRADISLYGLKSSFGRLRSTNKRQSRRIWKKTARRAATKEIKELMN